jgi:hypothetical protein
MHPGDANTRAVALATDHGRVAARVVPDATVREGVVSMTHGHLQENPGDLTSGEIGVDGLTAMPRVAGLEVRVTPLDEEANEPGS